jgi:hypothetical protein
MPRLGFLKPIRSLLAIAIIFACALLGPAWGQNNLVYQPNTRVLVDPIRVYLIYWVPPGVVLDTSVADGTGNFQSLMQQFVFDISGSDYFDILTQYAGVCGNTPCVAQNYTANPVIFGGAWVDTQVYPNAGTQLDPLTDSGIQSEITRAIGQNGWVSDQNSVFFVITGVFQSNNALVEECNGGNCTFRGSPSFCGYHKWFTSNNNRIVYAYLSDASFNTAGCAFGIATSPSGQIATDRAIALMSHELFESISDPDLNTWTDPQTNNEIGDNCNQQPATVVLNILNGTQYVVQQQWDNATSSCLGTSLTPGSFLSCSSPENSFIISDPGSNPMSVTQGGTALGIFSMAGPWVGPDLGEHATGNVPSTNLPSGSTTSTSPGFRNDPHCSGTMQLYVNVPFSASPGSYWARVRATDQGSGVTASYRLPIQIRGCTPLNSCPANWGLCGPISNNCGGQVDCGACGANLACSNSHCCPADEIYDTGSNTCRPQTCPVGTEWCPDQGECLPAKRCNPPICGGRPC